MSFFYGNRKKQQRDIIKENGIENVADIYSFFEDSFKDMLQEMLEAEMDSSLGYTKNNKGDIQTVHKRNGHSPKTVKSQYGLCEVDIPFKAAEGVASYVDYSYNFDCYMDANQC